MFFGQPSPHPVNHDYCYSEYKENYNHDIRLKGLNKIDNRVCRCMGNTCCKYAAATPIITPAENYP